MAMAISLSAYNIVSSSYMSTKSFIKFPSSAIFVKFFN